MAFFGDGRWMAQQKMTEELTVDQPMAARTFQIQVRLRAADGKWPHVPSTFRVSASTLDKLYYQVQLYCGCAVHVLRVKDEDEDEWVAVMSLAGIPDSTTLKLEIASSQPLSNDLAYSDENFLISKARAVSPIAHDAIGAVIPIVPGSLSTAALRRA